jgi:hypothetical protein
MLDKMNENNIQGESFKNTSENPNTNLGKRSFEKSSLDN